MLQSVEFGITYSRTNPATGIVEVEKGKAALPFFDVVSFVGRAMPGDVFSKHRKVTTKFSLLSFLAVTAKPPQCSFNHINYNVGEIWNPFLLPKGYYRCKRCICKLVSASYRVLVNAACVHLAS